MVRIAIDFDIPASTTAGLPAFKGVVFREVSRVPTVGEFIKLEVYDHSTGTVTLVYPVWRVTHYAIEPSSLLNHAEALVHMRLTAEGPQ